MLKSSEEIIILLQCIYGLVKHISDIQKSECEIYVFDLPDNSIPQSTDISA